MINITSVKKKEYLKLMKIEKSIFEKQVFMDQLKNYINEDKIKTWKISTTKVIGFVSFYHVIDEVEIIQIGIIKSHRRQHYGSLIIDRIKKLNIKRIFIEVSVENSQAIKFYMKNGFKKIGIRKGYYKVKNYRIDALRLLFQF
tara:strand:- start:33 stop:461 length:429 start_codon:yes stop_codon:yes gene_type:complete